MTIRRRAFTLIELPFDKLRTACGSGTCGVTLIELPFGKLRTACRSGRRGFTLIELLVVIAIIALLVTLLVPALQEAKRQAKVVLCATDLHAIGNGLAIYVAEEDGRYPVASAWYGIYVTGDPVDNRANLVRIAGEQTDIYYCPLDNHLRPEDNEHEVEYSEYFFCWPWGAGYAYSITYHPWFITGHVGGSGGFSYDWSHSGNPDGKPPFDPFLPRAAVVSDHNHARVWPPWEPEGVAHYGPDFANYSEGEHSETNVLYSDGHVETHHELEYYVRRSDGVYFPY